MDFLIEVNGLEFSLIRKSIKRLRLRLHADGRMQVSAPLSCSLNTIHRFLEDKQDWILKHRTRLLSKPKPLEAQFHTGELHSFLGQSYPLIVHESETRNGVFLEDHHILCYVPQNATSHLKKNLLHSWYREQMRLLLPQLIQKWEPIIGVQVHQWTIRAMTTRWGSCNVVLKKICLNLNLIQKPLRCLEYVLVHEMVHLLEASHNKRFYTLMTQFMPEWRVCKEQLKVC